MKEGIKIAISGKSGCGNTTVSKLVAERLGLRLINYTFKTMAKDLDMDFQELYEKAQRDLQYDRYLDRKQVEMAAEGDCVLGSRLAIWMLQDADLRVFLNARTEVRAKRIQEREGGVYETVLRQTIERDEKDRNRYLQLYEIDNNKFDFADLIIDVEKSDQFRTAETIINRARKIE